LKHYVKFLFLTTPSFFIFEKTTKLGVKKNELNKKKSQELITVYFIFFEKKTYVARE